MEMVISVNCPSTALSCVPDTALLSSNVIVGMGVVFVPASYDPFAASASHQGQMAVHWLHHNVADAACTFTSLRFYVLAPGLINLP
jgi:hypothetical protein